MASRFKDAIKQVVLTDQYAYLGHLSMHVAINDTQLRLADDDLDMCIASLDFSKAFDRVDRKYLFQLLRKMNLPPYLVDALENLYNKTTASINVYGYLSREVKLERGIRQGCPLSALHFIIALEPLLEILRRHPWYQYAPERRVIAYADDVNVYVHKEDLASMFQELDKFCKGTQLKVNRGKCRILKRREANNDRYTDKIKVLGVYQGSNKAVKLNRESKQKTMDNMPKYFNKSMSVFAKAQIIKTFFLPKFLHFARHSPFGRNLEQDFQKLSLSFVLLKRATAKEAK